MDKSLRNGLVASTERLPRTNSSSAKRSRIEDDNPGGDSSGRIALTKQSKQAASSPPQNSIPASFDPVEGPSTLPLISNMQYAEPSKRQKLDHKSKDTEPRKAPVEDVGPASHAELMSILAKAQADVARLKDEAAEKDRFCRQIELRVKQDMLLDILKEREEKSKMQFALDRQQRHMCTTADRNRKQIADLENNIAFERNKLVAAHSEARTWRAEVEHYQALTAGLETDLEELRKLNDEDRAKARDFDMGLPPAFGSIYDSDRLPPWDRHTDSGPVVISGIKRRIRTQLDQAANTALTKGAEIVRRHGSEVGASMASTEVMRTMTEAMVIHCYTLNKLIHYGIETRVIIVGGTPKTAKQQNLEAHVAANSIVDMLLDILWRTTSITEVRPATPSFDAREKARLGMYFSSVDNTLLTGLQAAFLDRRSLPDLQRRLTQLAALRTAFSSWRLDLHGPFFGQSMLWLGEQVEKERELAANAWVDPGQATYEEREANELWETVSSTLGSERPSLEPEGEAQPGRQVV